MRVPTKERRQFRMRGWMIAVVVILLMLLFSLRGLAGFYTDTLWFNSLGQGDTWWELLGARVVPALVFTVLFFAVLLANLLIADRLAPRVRGMGPPTPEDELVVRYQQTTARYQGRIRVLVAVFFALIAGIGVSAQWREWILFTNRSDFHIDDPQFHRDVGFYVFQLPFIKFMIDWLFAGLVIVLLVTAVAHYLNGGIRFQSPLQRVTPQVKAHISVILAVMALVKTADYFFSRFELNFSHRGAVDGAGYTDVHAQLPALEFLLIVSIIAALLFLWNIWRRGWVLPVIAVGLWAFISLIVGTIYPAAIQNFKVKPDEFATERKFIERNIQATRDAFGLSKVKVRDFAFDPVLDGSVVEINRPTIDNARLWDPEIAEAAYQTLQGLQGYYRITDTDVDRYNVDGVTRQVIIGARELNGQELPSQSWVNEHLVYTHGYGAVASPTNEATASGDPSFLLRDIPPKGDSIDLGNESAALYFGEGLDGYAIVDAKQNEFNYSRNDGRQVSSRYHGKDGVQLSNFLKKAAFALRFGDANPLISGQVTSDSKVLMVRDIRERASKLAPFLSFDDDPYPVVVDGKIVWVLDGYTTSDAYPYAQVVNGSGGLPGEFNYARNSVKATVDAYDGTVTFYVIDRSDPIIRAYEKAFPDLFSSFGSMPEALREHLRYPQDLFTVQSGVFGDYHITSPRVLYQGNQRWLRSPDPNAADTVSGGGGGSSQRGTGRSAKINATSPRQDPYYLYIRLPQDDHESFLIIQPYVPVSRGNQQIRLSSFMTAKSDPSEYGKLETFVMPQGRTVQGPVQVANSIDSDDVLAKEFTQLDQQGSQLEKGNIQLIPVGDSIIYIQPIFVRREGLGYPQFQFVVAFVQNEDPVFAKTVNEAIDSLFGIDSSTPTEPTTPSDGTETVTDLLNQAFDKFTAADAALKAGDLETYARLEKEGRALVEQARTQLADGGSTTSSSTPDTQQASVR